MSVNITSRGNGPTGECPPLGNYNVIIREVGGLRESEGFPDQNGVVKTDVNQSMWTFEIADYDYDIDDEDDYNWNGERIDQYFTFYTTYRESGKTTDTYLADLGSVNPFLTALMGRKPTGTDDIPLGDFVGRKLTVKIEPKASGKPKMSSPVPVKVKRRKPAPVVVPVEVDDDDEEDDFDEVTRSDKAA